MAVKQASGSSTDQGGREAAGLGDMKSRVEVAYCRPRRSPAVRPTANRTKRLAATRRRWSEGREEIPHVTTRT
jgi:hypothetical protein